MNEQFSNYFSAIDEGFFHRFADWRTKLLKPFVPLLDLLGMTPDLLSYLAVSMLLPLIFVFTSHPKLGTLLIICYMLIDGVDGAYARIKQATTEGGALTDILCDQLGLIVIGLCSIHYGLLKPTWGAFYLCIYIAMICLVVYQNKLGLKVKGVLRTKYVLFLLYVIYAFTGKSFMNAIGPVPVIPVFAIIHTISVIISFLQIKHFCNDKGAAYIQSGEEKHLLFCIKLPNYHRIMTPSLKGYLFMVVMFLLELLLVVIMRPDLFYW